jgi:hypothetical protein
MDESAVSMFLVEELKMDVVGFSEMLLPTCQTSQKNQMVKTTYFRNVSNHLPICQIPDVLKMESAGSSGMLVTIYRTTLCQGPEYPTME